MTQNQDRFPVTH